MDSNQSMSTPQEREDEKVRSDLLAIARSVEHQLPYGWGFVVLAFPFGAGGRMNYISNAQRADIVRAMYEFIEATKGKWGEHVPEESSAAQDEQLGRARQRVAELEGLLASRALSASNLADLTWILGEAKEFFGSQGNTSWAQRAARYKTFFEAQG